MNMNYIGLAAGGYMAASYFFLRNPQWLHKPKSGNAVPLIAHRGGAAEGYENTLKNFARAVANGCNMLELDVQLTRDNQVVVCHDGNLKRIAGHFSKIGDLSYAELPPIQETIPIDFDPGQVMHDANWTKNERKICLLKDVLKAFPKVQVNIDIKQKNQKLVDKTNAIIRAARAEGRCVWGSFDGETTDMCYRANPNVGLFFSSARLLITLILFYTGLLPFVALRETHLEIPMLSVFLAEKFKLDCNTVSFGKLPHLLLRVCDFLLLRPSFIKHLKDRGIPTYLWVLNSEEEFERGFGLGASGVMTDYPSKLKEWLLKGKTVQRT